MFKKVIKKSAKFGTLSLDLKGMSRDVHAHFHAG